jgi:hypothetical protein
MSNVTLSNVTFKLPHSKLTLFNISLPPLSPAKSRDATSFSQFLDDCQTLINMSYFLHIVIHIPLILPLLLLYLLLFTLHPFFPSDHIPVIYCHNISSPPTVPLCKHLARSIHFINVKSFIRDIMSSNLIAHQPTITFLILLFATTLP